MVKKKRLAQQSGPLAAALLLALGLTGCAAPLERAAVDLQAVPTTEGVAWGYRTMSFEAEGILPGAQGAFDLRADAAHLRRSWRRLDAHVTVADDNVSSYILIQLWDRGTGLFNPVRGGLLSWGLHDLQTAVLESLGVMGKGSMPRYSVHMIALGDDQRPTWDSSVVAQMRVRRLSNVMIEAGVDPRVITGQVWDKREQNPWKLALVLRPYRYGYEQTSGALVAPGSF